jgi:restriction endonuclease S subunit
VENIAWTGISGGAGRNKTLGQSEFVKLLIQFHHKNKIAIAAIINSAEKEIELLKTKLELLKDQKGLMQQLLTGKKD